MIPPFLVGPAIGAGALALGLALGVAWLKGIHEPAIRAEYAAELAAATAKAQAEFQSAALEAVEAAQAAARARQAERVVVRERIIREPVTTACVDSPSVVAALDGLRSRPAGPGAPGGAALPAGLPAPARAPSRP
jgi:hypothetical protein